MKLKLFDRILLAILLIAAILAAFVLFGVALRLVPESTATGFVSLFYLNAQNALILAGSAALLLLIAVRLVFAGRSSSTKAPKTALIRANEIGGTYISLAALDSMAQKHCRAESRVRECHTSVQTVEGGISIGIRLSVLPDTDVNALSASLQSTLKEYIESYTGVPVKEIGILIESMTAQANTAISTRME